MKMSKTKWFNWYSCIIILTAVVETGALVPGGFFKKVSLAILSGMTIIFGLLISSFVIGGQFAFAKKLQSITGPKYAQMIKAIAVFVFWFGVVVSGITLFTYPFSDINDLPFSMAPVGIGFALGARWMQKKHC